MLIKQAIPVEEAIKWPENSGDTVCYSFEVSSVANLRFIYRV